MYDHANPRIVPLRRRHQRRGDVFLVLVLALLLLAALGLSMRSV